jgi:DNA repair photolyase
MIISASRRTDIPAFYSQWFINRIKEGYVLVPNPYNLETVSKISLDPSVVDCIVFWTKDPRPMITQLNQLQDYKYYFQFTLNPYGKEIENNLPSIKERIEIFKKLSDKIGKEKVIWRYDPILTNSTYNVSFHKEAFAEIAYGLKDHTEKCMLGFIDHYFHIQNSVNQFDIKPLQKEEIENMAMSFKETIDQYKGITLDTCTVKVDLRHLDIPSGLCIDKELIERIIGYPILAKKDKNQRDICNCIESIDIGMYESCLNGCIYCYAIKGNYHTAKNNNTKHDINSPILIGKPSKDTIIKEREMKSLRNNQFPLFL